MLKPYVPVMNSSLNRTSRELLLGDIRASGAELVFIALDRTSLFERGDHIKRLKENLRFFENSGLEVGVWFQAFGFGDPLSYERCGWTRLQSLSGNSPEIDALCPEDPDFLAAYLEWVRDIASTRPRIMMLDDDLCLSVRPGIGCFCKRHVKLLRKEVGEELDLTKIFVGGRNKHRDGWYKVMGDTVRRFCRAVRDAVDEIDSTIRVGVCAGYTSWDIEGTDPIEMAKILAGNTKPFYRLTGAPYWESVRRFPGQRLSAIIENTRNQIFWSDGETEYFAEADSFPRPCYNTPAMLVENFDIAMHASGVRSLKYLFDYHSSPRYEKQYLKIHCRNIPLYEKIEKAFSGMTPAGVRVYRPPHRIKNAILPETFCGEDLVMRSYFSNAAAMLACHAIPVSYEGESDSAAVFGDDALYFEDVHKRVVRDISAALILKDRGFDVGIDSITATGAPAFEFFRDEKVLLTGIGADVKFYDLKLKDGAVPTSFFDTGAVASLEYKNFLILNFDSLLINESSALYRSYARGEQLQKFFKNPHPAIYGYADIYSISATSGNKETVLFENLSIDPVFDFDIVLPKKCKSVEIHGVLGELLGDRIRVTSDFLPSSVILLEITYEED